MRPVVIQTMWRTGGTYLAFHLRERNPVALFYEPLHEDYSRFTRADWDRFAEAGAEAPRGHPRKAFHYLTDYPFLPDAGVVGHQRAFACERFVLCADDEAAELAAYLDGLLRFAQQLGRRPLFKFCRGFLRQPWLKRKLDPVTVYLARSAAGMAGSYARIGGGGYFYSGYLRILARNWAEPALAPLYDRVARAHPEYAAASEVLVESDQLATVVSPDVARDVFLFFWALALAAHADGFVLDANALSEAPQANAEALRALTGLDVDLLDATPLDRGEAEWLRFSESALSRFLREALAGSRIDLTTLPTNIAGQFAALAGG